MKYYFIAIGIGHQRTTPRRGGDATALSDALDEVGDAHAELWMMMVDVAAMTRRCPSAFRISAALAGRRRSAYEQRRYRIAPSAKQQARMSDRRQRYAAASHDYAALSS